MKCMEKMMYDLGYLGVASPEAQKGEVQNRGFCNPPQITIHRKNVSCGYCYPPREIHKEDKRIAGIATHPRQESLYINHANLPIRTAVCCRANHETYLYTNSNWTNGPKNSIGHAAAVARIAAHDHAAKYPDQHGRNYGTVLAHVR